MEPKRLVEVDQRAGKKRLSNESTEAVCSLGFGPCRPSVANIGYVCIAL